MQVAKYLSVASIMATVAWFFWNPVGWSLEWEPIVVLLASLAAFIGFDWKDHSGARKAEHEETPVHPSDVFLFKQFVELLPSNGVIHFLETHDFLGSFNQAQVQTINQFLYEWNNVEHEFQDKDIEALKGKLFEASSEFSKLIGAYTSPNKHGFQAVFPDHYEGGEQRKLQFQREAKEIGDAADLVVMTHQEFVRAGRLKFGDGTF